MSASERSGFWDQRHTPQVMMPAICLSQSMAASPLPNPRNLNTHISVECSPKPLADGVAFLQDFVA
jgi:hypothetical protein